MECPLVEKVRPTVLPASSQLEKETESINETYGQRSSAGGSSVNNSNSCQEFSLVTDPDPSEKTLEGVKALISKHKKQYEALLEDQKDLTSSRDERRDLTTQFKERTKKLTVDLEKDESFYKDEIENQKATLDSLKEEENNLMEEIKKIQAEIKEEDDQNVELKEQADVFCSMPEKKFVFKGLTKNAEDRQEFDMKSHITYPMDGGTALITFEEEDVASSIMMMKRHKVELGVECRIIVQAHPVHLMLPSLVEIDSEVCPRRILLSNLPKMNTEILLNKLEIHFSKTKNGGGEVDVCDYLPDSGTVVIVFIKENVAKHLVETEFHEVKLNQTKHKVRVTPFLNGKITNLQTKMSMCPRTVLLTGIPDIMEQETLQDLLEIHFQKNSNGGGEIEAILYNPLGQNLLALFGNTL
ncbi:transcript variant X3 [Nothobranchius furzeri]|uniref:Transcript variant X3 n=1 Tax=Nothobranchius furzeri TaxID=105023 RepID=A0A9D2YVP6_NOTFU|nr:transcript variant X3 [Nothobranchius furzeri]